MIILDTNAVSETMKPQPEAAVLAWLDAQIAETLYPTGITLAELLLTPVLCQTFSLVRIDLSLCSYRPFWQKYRSCGSSRLAYLFPML